MPSADRHFRLLVRHSAAAKDVALAGELLRHLDVLKRFAGVDVWNDARIQPGDETRREIERAIDQADVALLLLSSDFLASDGFVDREVPQLLERHWQGHLRIIPVLLRSCLWELHPWLKELHPLPKGGKPIGAFSGDARDSVLTELAREIVGLTTLSTSEGAISSPRRPEGTTATAAKGGATFHISIQNSTLGSVALGDGATTNGRVDLRQVVEEKQPPDAATAPSRSSPRPLVVLGPHVIAEGERIAASGNTWTVRLRRFLLGDTSTLSQVSEDNGTLPPDERFIVLSEPGEARAIARDLTWREETDYIEVHVSVAPLPPRQSVVELESTDIDTMRTVHGAAAGRTFVQTWLGTAIGQMGDRFGSWIPEWLRTPELTFRLDDLVKIEILRLSSVPCIDDFTSEIIVPLGFVDRVLAVQSRVEQADDHTIPVDIELVFVRSGRWKGEIRVARQPVDPEAHDKLLKKLLAQANRF